MSLPGPSSSGTLRGSQHIDQNQGLDPFAAGSEISQVHGGLGEHHFEQVDAHPPRTISSVFSAIWDGIKSLASSALKALTSLFPRANADNNPQTRDYTDIIKEQVLIPPSAEERSEQVIGGAPIGITENMWGDLDRATYNIQHADDRIEPLLQKQADTYSETDKLQAVDKLKQFAGNDEALAKISSRMHQGTLAPYQGALLGEFSPISHHGARGYMLGDNHPTYTLAKNDDGSFNLRSEMISDNANQFFPVSGGQVQPPVTLNAEASYSHYTLDMTFDRHGDLIPDSLRSNLDYHIATADQ